MPSIRLNAAMREAIVNKAVASKLGDNKSFNDYSREVELKISEELEAYVRNTHAEEFRVIEGLPESVLPYINMANGTTMVQDVPTLDLSDIEQTIFDYHARRSAGNRVLDVELKKEIPCTSSYHKISYRVVRPVVKPLLDEWATRYDAREELHAVLTRALAGIRTVEELEKEFPELMPFVPGEVVPPPVDMTYIAQARKFFTGAV